MAMITREKFDEVVRNCLAKFCDEEVMDETKNVDPDGYLKMRTVIWRYKPYRFQAKYMFGGTEESPIWVPLNFTATLDGSMEEAKLESTEALADKICKAKIMREAGMV